MATEIERKFLVSSESWREAVELEVPVMQGYLAGTSRLTLRARLQGDQGVLTIKGASRGISRSEFEYPIPAEDAKAMLAELAEYSIVEKTRYLVRFGAHLWEIDVFAGDNAGLVLAEIELSAEDEDFERPAWLGPEVSDDPRYYNANLARHPYKEWGR
ncbi:CYTH domain-containing protein [Halochromatium glycolicum]|uniref:Adenylate cyclase n=1 Tax=Halochromatium glycolicum TaxID=85075 RepID=A0AAJ0U1G0_9GAMM|nr:CYTH domain-containing protein [Halochromatium glycolicum]MBK1703496.1 adenylate cyclase [Halochromatium glycolicum]